MTPANGANLSLGTVGEPGPYAAALSDTETAATGAGLGS